MFQMQLANGGDVKTEPMTPTKNGIPQTLIQHQVQLSPHPQPPQLVTSSNHTSSKIGEIWNIIFIITCYKDSNKFLIYNWINKFCKDSNKCYTILKIMCLRITVSTNLNLFSASLEAI